MCDSTELFWHLGSRWTSEIGTKPGSGSFFWFWFCFRFIVLFLVNCSGSGLLFWHLCVADHLVPGGGLGLGSHLQERLHGRPQLWRLRAYQTTGERKKKLHWPKLKLKVKVEGWFKLMTLEEGKLSCHQLHSFPFYQFDFRTN